MSHLISQKSKKSFSKNKGVIMSKKITDQDGNVYIQKKLSIKDFGL